jgi:signal transduction histidine kinase
MALVLAATGAFVYLRMRSELDHAVDQGLRSRTADLVALVRESDQGLTESGSSPLTERGEGLAQVLTAEGAVLDATPQFRSRPLLGGAQLRRALRHPLVVEHSRLRGLEGPARLLTTPVRAQDRQLVAVVGASLDDRDEALHLLLLLLALGGPVALALASLAGYGVAAAALRPVESMRSEAEAVSLAEPGRRLPVPAADDELARLATTLNEMLARQESAFARERTFVSDASHELRTPLAILRTELELALRRGRTVEELEAALRSAMEESDRLVRLAEDLLVVAQSDQGRLQLRVETEPAAELLERVRERFAARAGGAGRSIDVEAGAGVTLRADRLRVEQALGNLVENAIRHGEGGVMLGAAERDGEVELRVRDDGPGFPDDFIDAAFERFSRADAGRSRGGTGLGLSIVAAIAAAHGGAAGARNLPAGGAEVWMSVPSSSAHRGAVPHRESVDQEGPA